jgi:hypothetical protein
MHIEVRYFEGRVTVGGNPALSMFCRDCRRGAIDFGLLTWFHHPDFARTDDFRADLARFLDLVNCGDLSFLKRERNRRKLRRTLCGCDDFGRTASDLHREPTREEQRAQAFADKMHALHPDVVIDELVHRDGLAWGAKFYTPAGGYLWEATLRQIEERIRSDVQQAAEAGPPPPPSLRLL